MELFTSEIAGPCDGCSLEFDDSQGAQLVCEMACLRQDMSDEYDCD